MGRKVCSLPFIFVQHCKEQIPKIETNIPRKGISTFMCLVSDLYILPASICLFCCKKNVDRFWEYIAHRHMNVETGTESAQFPEMGFSLQCTVHNKIQKCCFFKQKNLSHTRIYLFDSWSNYTVLNLLHIILYQVHAESGNHMKGHHCVSSNRHLDATLLYSHQRVCMELRPRLSCGRLIRLLPHPLPPSPVSKSSLFLSLPLCRR